MNTTAQFINPESEFNFNVNADIIKSDGNKIEKEADLDYNNMWIQGVASDNTNDAEGESLSPKTFQLDYFMKVGKITYEHGHKETPTKAIGEPRKAIITPQNQFFVKAILYSSSDLAKDVYKQTWILQNDPNSTRRMQWSIEGKRIWENNKVVGAIITHVTLTQNPINYKNTYAEVVKKAFNINSDKPEQLNTDDEIQKSIKESELMLLLHSIDSNIYSQIQKAEKYCEILMYCEKYPNYKQYFTNNTIDKLNQLVQLNDIKKSYQYIDIIFGLINKYPSASDYFNKDIVKKTNEIITRAENQ